MIVKASVQSKMATSLSLRIANCTLERRLVAPPGEGVLTLRMAIDVIFNFSATHHLRRNGTAYSQQHNDLCELCAVVNGSWGIRRMKKPHLRIIRNVCSDLAHSCSQDEFYLIHVFGKISIHRAWATNHLGGLHGSR